jgi:hypothetical protein
MWAMKFSDYSVAVCRLHAVYIRHVTYGTLHACCYDELLSALHDSVVMNDREIAAMHAAVPRAHRNVRVVERRRWTRLAEAAWQACETHADAGTPSDRATVPNEGAARKLLAVRPSGWNGKASVAPRDRA